MRSVAENISTLSSPYSRYTTAEGGEVNVAPASSVNAPPASE